MTRSTGMLSGALLDLQGRLSASSQEQLAYAAGLFDGEGCIGVYQQMTRRGCQTRFVINVANTDPRPLEWLASHFGGTITNKEAKQRGRHRACHTWYLLNSRARAFLLAIRPFLLVKGEQADLAEQFAMLCKRGGRVTPELLRLRADLASSISRLKRSNIAREVS